MLPMFINKSGNNLCYSELTSTVTFIIQKTKRKLRVNTYVNYLMEYTLSNEQHRKSRDYI